MLVALPGPCRRARSPSAGSCWHKRRASGFFVCAGLLWSAVSRLAGTWSAIVLTLKPDSMSVAGERRFSVSNAAPRSMKNGSSRCPAKTLIAAAEVVHPLRGQSVVVRHRPRPDVRRDGDLVRRRAEHGPVTVLDHRDRVVLPEPEARRVERGDRRDRRTRRGRHVAHVREREPRELHGAADLVLNRIRNSTSSALPSLSLSTWNV